jgi:thymidylate synthase ThyX
MNQGKSQGKTVNCKKCATRDACVKPCAALTKYINASFKSGRKTELNIGVPIYVKDIALWDLAPQDMQHPSDREKALLTLDIAGFPRVKICQLFGIKRASLRSMLYHARQKCK